MFNDTHSYCEKHLFRQMRNIYDQILAIEDNFIHNEEFFKYWRKVSKHFFKDMSLVSGLKSINLQSVSGYFCEKNLYS